MSVYCLQKFTVVESLLVIEVCCVQTKKGPGFARTASARGCQSKARAIAPCNALFSFLLETLVLAPALALFREHPAGILSPLVAAS